MGQTAVTQPPSPFLLSSISLLPVPPFDGSGRGITPREIVELKMLVVEIWSLLDVNTNRFNARVFRRNKKVDFAPPLTSLFCPPREISVTHFASQRVPLDTPAQNGNVWSTTSSPFHASLLDRQLYFTMLVIADWQKLVRQTCLDSVCFFSQRTIKRFLRIWHYVFTDRDVLSFLEYISI